MSSKDMIEYCVYNDKTKISVAIIDNGVVTYHTYGNNGQEDKVYDYEIGSISKTYLGLLFSKAISEGKVQLSDSVSKYLNLDRDKYYPTIERLLTHKFLRKNIGVLKDKKVVVFYCGASPYGKKGFIQIKELNMKGELANIPLFYCRGAWDLDSMSFIDRKLCNVLRKMLSKKDPSEYEPWAKALMDAGDEKADWTDKKYIMPILDFINK